jgi:hypothetical protein
MAYAEVLAIHAAHRAIGKENRPAPIRTAQNRLFSEMKLMQADISGPRAFADPSSPLSISAAVPGAEETAGLHIGFIGIH